MQLGNDISSIWVAYNRQDMLTESVSTDDMVSLDKIGVRIERNERGDDGGDRYYEYHRDQAVAWLTSNSQDFRVICRLADLDPDYTHLKMSKALKSDIQQLRRNYYKKQKPERENRPGRYRLKF